MVSVIDPAGAGIIIYAVRATRAAQYMYPCSAIARPARALLKLIKNAWSGRSQ